MRAIPFEGNLALDECSMPGKCVSVRANTETCWIACPALLYTVRPFTKVFINKIQGFIVEET